MVAIIKWLLYLLQAVKCGHVDSKNLQNIVLILASTCRKGIVENADEIANILGLDSLEEILKLIPITNTTFTSSHKSNQEAISEMNKSIVGLLCSTCLALLVQGTMSNSPQTEVPSLKSILPALCKTILANKEKKSHYCVYISKQLVSNIQREALTYKRKCEQVIETMTAGSPQSVDIFRSLFKDS